jgi:DNA-binding MarR family transcriptional regulator
MTALTDKLLAENKIKRIPDEKDRRVVKIEITAAGKETLKEAREIMKKEFREKLSVLSAAEIDTLSKSLENVKRILSEISLNSPEEKK